MRRRLGLAVAAAVLVGVAAFGTASAQEATTTSSSTTTSTPVPPSEVDVSGAAVFEGDSGTTPAQFTFTLDHPLPQDATVTYETADGSAIAGLDYVSTTGTVVFAPGETSRTVSVKVIGDTVREPTESFELRITESSQNTFRRLPNGTGTGTITDDDENKTLSTASGVTSTSSTTTTTRPLCDPNYPGLCIPPFPPDLNCDQISARDFNIPGADPHGFDGDNNRIGCESTRFSGGGGTVLNTVASPVGGAGGTGTNSVIAAPTRGALARTGSSPAEMAPVGLCVIVAGLALARGSRRAAPRRSH